jgi:plastocyanin
MKGLRNRILIPLSIPVAATLVIVVVVFNFSRVLLFLERRHSSDVSTAVAIVAASAVLFGCAYFGSTRRAPTAGIPVLAGVGMVLLFAGGYGAGASHATEKGGGGESASGAGGAATVGAKEFAFDPNQLTLPPGIITVTLRNDGRSLHTFLIENHPEFKKLEAASGATATGAVKLPPGTYTFYCSELGHRGSGMEGKLTVTKGGK